MADPFDAELDDRLARLSAAVPFESRGEAQSAASRTSPVGRAVWRSPIRLSVAPLVAIVILVVGIGLVGPGRQSPPGASPERPSGSASAVASVDAAAYPGVCATLSLSPNQCAGFAAWAIGQAGLVPGHVALIKMTKVDCPGVPPCPTESTGYLVNVHLANDRGGVSDEVVGCTRRNGALGGINILCGTISTGDGRLIQYPQVASAISGGYRDTPCSGEGPTGCATPLPTIEPSALADSQPLTIKSLEIPIDHAGSYSVILGQASLPNGILSAASAEVASSPTKPLVGYDGYHITVTSLSGGPSFTNYYQHGWRAGTERVEVTLSFVVLMFEPGDAVVVSNVDVH